MNRWQRFVSEHGEIEVLNEHAIIMKDTSYINGTPVKYFDDIIHRQEDGTYTVVCVEHGTNVVNEIYPAKTIKWYLNY